MASPAVLHVLNRATFGPTPALVERVRRLGPDAWLRRQLAPSAIPDSHCDAVVKRFPDAGRSIPQVRAAYSNGAWDAMFGLVRTTIARAVWSERQLFEVMVDFWSNHLNVTCPSSDVWDNRAHYDTHVIRRHALGSFSEMLVAASLHPAMLRYLDNASSSKAHPNENQGRELLELHTVGVAAGYTETDVQNSARILTGLTVDWQTGEARYRPSWHHTGPVQVLDFRHPNDSAAGGRDVAVAYLRHLARHPATAHTIARKLAIRFVSDDPPPSLVSALAATYLARGTAVGPVLSQLFRSREFTDAREAKVRRPYEDVVATLRVLGVGPDVHNAKNPKGTAGVEALHWILADMGHVPLAWSLPDGYPDVAPAWQSPAGTLARWNFHLNLTAGWWPKTLALPRTAGLLGPTLPATHGRLVDTLALRLLHRGVTSAERAAVCAFLDATPATPVHRTSAAVTWRLPFVVALLLDSPRHAIR